MKKFCSTRITLLYLKTTFPKYVKVFFQRNKIGATFVFHQKKTNYYIDFRESLT